jgi:hypothetical protein
MSYTIIIWKLGQKEFIKRDVKFETKTEATAYAQGIYDSLREMCDLVGYTVREK